MLLKLRHMRRILPKGFRGREIDDRMADARRNLDWDAQFACALDPETAKAIRDSRSPEDDHSDTFSMCGKFCAVRSMNKALAGEYIDILQKEPPYIFKTMIPERQYVTVR